MSSPSQSAAPATRERLVLSVLRQIQPASTGALAASPALGMDVQGVRNHVAALCRAGHVRLVPGTRPRLYEVTAAAPGGAGCT